MAFDEQSTARAPGAATAALVILVLYIAEGGPNSIQALANLQAICDEHLKGNFRLEIIDVLESPQRALADGIVVTPSLSKLSPSPARRIIGNLSDKSSVLRALGIARRAP
jgi:circadian clock protein KaiB